jgi:hypothetical protein
VRIGMFAGCRLLLSAAIASSTPLARAAEPAPANAACADNATTDFKRKADLPKGLLKMVDGAGPMADVNEPFNGTDVAQPELPFCRFLSARQSDCVVWVHYQHGGFVGGVGIVRLRQSGSVWAVEDGDFVCPHL